MARLLAGLAILCVLSLAVAALKWHGGRRKAEGAPGRPVAASATGGTASVSAAGQSEEAAVARGGTAPPERTEGLIGAGAPADRTCRKDANPVAIPASVPGASAAHNPNLRCPSPSGAAAKILEGAKAQVREGAVYTPGYFRIDYPNGDLPRDKGVCADVIVRALRCAGFDLQKLIHEDMRAAFDAYPQNRIWGLTRPDPNIDHRRVPNQVAFFSRHGISLAIEFSPATRDEWLPGDIVFWKLPNGRDHCGIISDAENAKGVPLVIHNLEKCAEEDCLLNWKIVGHFRYPPPKKR